MSLYDTLTCEYPLPDGVPAWATEFQTKSLDCELDHYTITVGGRLLKQDDHDHSLADFTGVVEFYTGNVVSVGPGVYTRDGEDAVWLEYRATFIHGLLHDVVRTEFRTEPAAKARHLSKLFPVVTPEQIEEQKKRQAQLLTGGGLYVWWGGSDQGYWVSVIAENDTHLVVERQDDTRKFEILNRSDRDRLFFDSLEAGQRYLADRQARWDAEKAEYEAEIASKKK